MHYSSFRMIFRNITFLYIFMAFMIKYSTLGATEVAVNIQTFDTFNKFLNTYHKMEEAVSANYSRICGRELIYALIKKCTPTNSTYPCFQSSTNTIYADRKSNRSYRRGVATVCCDYGKCSQEYLATFCCEKLAVAQ
ncbi:hypothetical protein WUBG_05855 [Wuchereria bancrofti]|uniref:Insulin-like domain-containing protein n=2 Tax=Wuchereria bancrofti TaxID=6293 RepID=J9EM19_WUCBA|nr:hypothetical protein WUBG_05855 [Wuchereria bancrofti]